MNEWRKGRKISKKKVEDKKNKMEDAVKENQKKDNVPELELLRRGGIECDKGRG